jgi:hypothetical protein
MQSAIHTNQTVLIRTPFLRLSIALRGLPLLRFHVNLLKRHAWFSVKGGELCHKKFLIFTGGMLLGQIGAGIETYQHEAWRALIVQGYFFVFTAFGGIQRFRKMRRSRPPLPPFLSDAARRCPYRTQRQHAFVSRSRVRCCL